MTEKGCVCKIYKKNCLVYVMPTRINESSKLSCITVSDQQEACSKMHPSKYISEVILDPRCYEHSTPSLHIMWQHYSQWFQIVLYQLRGLTLCNPALHATTTQTSSI